MTSSTSLSATFTHRGRRIRYREHGSGPRVVVLAHGLLMDSRMYTRLAPALAVHGHRVITVDLPGHGDSDQPHDMTAYSMQQYGRDVIALLDHLGVTQAVVGGTSLGANVALEVAVLAAVLDATRSPVLRLCLNPVTTVVGGSAALRAAIYVEPASNVAGWRLLAAWMTRPRAEDLERILAVLAARDAATLEHLSRGRRKPRRSSR